MEYLDIVDENGEPTGDTVERSRAHREGIRHRTAHVWLVRIRDGRAQILLQKRSRIKDSHPECYDMSSGGHIPAGVDYLPSAVRELWEEIGVHAREQELICCGVRRFFHRDIFHGNLFLDNQVSRVYVLWRDTDQFTLQEEEVEEVRWMDYETCREMVKKNSLPHCIVLEELDMIGTQLLV